MRRCVLLAFAALAAFALPAADMASQKWAQIKIDEGLDTCFTNAATRAMVESLVRDAALAEAKRVLGERTLIGKATRPLYFNDGTNIVAVAYLRWRDVPALAVTNSTNATVTNGAVFAWAGGGVYTNAQLGCAIVSTQTNFVWNGIGSTVADGRVTFAAADGFDVTGLRLTKEEAREVKGE